MSKDGPKVQGEGDDESARKYQQDTKRFVDAGKVKPAADQARTDDPAEQADLERAEQAGRARAKEEDRLLRPDAGRQPGMARDGGGPQATGEGSRCATDARRHDGDSAGPGDPPGSDAD